VQDELLYLDQKRVMLKYLLPLSEIVIDFYDQIKSISSGYARFVCKLIKCCERLYSETGSLVNTRYTYSCSLLTLIIGQRITVQQIPVSYVPQR
jgi:translation elongation factor EF-4